MRPPEPIRNLFYYRLKKDVFTGHRRRVFYGLIKLTPATKHQAQEIINRYNSLHGIEFLMENYYLNIWSDVNWKNAGDIIETAAGNIPLRTGVKISITQFHNLFEPLRIQAELIRMDHKEQGD